jgi:hypothetical protein
VIAPPQRQQRHRQIELHSASLVQQSTPIPHGIVDGWYVDAEEFAKEDKSLFAAACRFVSGWPEGEHPAECLAPTSGQSART